MIFMRISLNLNWKKEKREKSETKFEDEVGNWTGGRTDGRKK